MANLSKLAVSAIVCLGKSEFAKTPQLYFLKEEKTIQHNNYYLVKMQNIIEPYCNAMMCTNQWVLPMVEFEHAAQFSI